MDVTGHRIDLAEPFRRNGYLIGPLVAPSLMRRLSHDSGALLMSNGEATQTTRPRGAPRTAVPHPRRHAGQPGGTPVLERETCVKDVARQLPAAAEIARHDDTLLLATHLTGAHAVDLVASSLVHQPAGSTMPTPHQAIEGTAERPPDLIAWIAIDDHFEDAAGLHLVPGSHTDPGLPERIAQAVALPASWVALLDPRLRHVTPSATSDRPHRALVLAYAARRSDHRAWRSAGGSARA